MILAFHSVLPCPPHDSGLNWSGDSLWQRQGDWVLDQGAWGHQSPANTVPTLIGTKENDCNDLYCQASK